METFNPYLIAGAALSFVAAALHVAIIFGGADWYRFFGAGEKFATAAAAGKMFPHIVTAGIAGVLTVWGAYGLSGAGAIAKLPLLKLALTCITGVYLARGLALVPLLSFARSHATNFLIWSSIICLGIGAVHLLGLVQVWGSI